MTDLLQPARIKRRHRAERRFRRFGLAAILLAATVLCILLVSIISKGYPVLQQAKLQIQVHLDPALISGASAESIRRGNYRKIISDALATIAPDRNPATRRAMRALINPFAELTLMEDVLRNPLMIGEKRMVTINAADDIDQYLKYGSKAAPRLSAMQIRLIESLQQRGVLRLQFNDTFFTSGDSREPEMAGLYGALKGSMLTLLITFVLSFPVGVMAAVYLQEFARNGRWKDWIEVNISNLAAVPSIVFGLLGLSLFVKFFDVPRSTPLLGGMVLALMTMPTIIIATRSALQSIPDSIRQAAQGLGASPIQVVFHHIIPCALPGILTGTIIGMSRALGETAPLLLIGMVAFIAQIPDSVLSASSVLPVQIYIWSNDPEHAFMEKTAATIMVLMVFLMVMNALAIYLRSKLEKQW